MKVRDIMTTHPILATARGADRDRAARIMEDARVNHVPVMEGDLVIGVWAHPEGDSIVLLGPPQVAEARPDDDAGEAMAALMHGAEVVLVREGGVPSGILTRSDALAILRTALGRGVGRRYPRPTVIRLVGSRGVGKTTLIMRTLRRLQEIDAVVLQANQPTAAGTLGGIDEIHDAAAHWRAGLSRAVARLADTQLIIVEDRDEVPDLSHGIGEDLQVALLRADEVAALPAERLDDAQAIVITRADEPGLHATQEALAACAQRWPRLEVFAVAAAVDDRGMDDWTGWITRQVHRRRS